eukprot:6422408-Amphidinium_carterae.1
MHNVMQCMVNVASARGRLWLLSLAVASLLGEKRSWTPVGALEADHRGPNVFAALQHRCVAIGERESGMDDSIQDEYIITPFSFQPTKMTMSWVGELYGINCTGFFLCLNTCACDSYATVETA